jgi:xanthine dehydrogenase accessory factor
MRRELLDLASDLARRGEPFALATVVARKPPISAQVGDMALVTREGFHGWVGGSCTRPTVTAEARQALEDGQPRLISLDPDPESQRRPGLKVFPMTCHSGGSVEIHIQPVLPAPRLLVYGVAPTARALARLAKAMGYTVWAVDAIADASAFPGADIVATAPQKLPADKTSAPVFAVVATQGQWDEEALLAAIAQDPAYLGVVASPKRFGEMRAFLTGKASEAALARVRNPAGLDLGGRLPAELALRILAEIVKEQHAAAGRPATRPEPASTTSAAATGEAVDPVCGMTVRVADARYQARHAGRDFYFCAASCRERFLASPERYLTVTEAR